MTTAREIDLAGISDHVGQLGLGRLHPDQGRAVIEVLAGRDVVAVLPTGAGKSAIYQIAGSMVPGVTIVVSPLLALQDDQLRSIEASDLPDAVRIDGSTPAEAVEDAIDRAERGAIEFLFVTPERLLSLLDDRALSAVDVSLLVVDEAHCIVTWGHGYRPAFLALGEARRRLGGPATLALTASADPRMRRDIAAVLGLAEPATVVGSIVRDNLSLDLVVVDDHRRALAAVVESALAVHGRTIVYVPTRALAEEVRDAVADQGRPATTYHGGLDRAERADAIERIRRCDRIVVAATTAFGMGIDLPDVRGVVHLDLPPSLVDYYQEIGRAGRDGRPATAVAVVTGSTSSRRAFTGGGAETDLGLCVAAHRALVDGATSRRAIAEALDTSLSAVSRALSTLEEAGVVGLRPSPSVLLDEADVAELHAAATRLDEFQRSQRAAVDRYAAGGTCRWQQIGAALGEVVTPCGHCDRCQRSLGATDPGSGGDGVAANADDRVGRRVSHGVFGDGRIATIDGDVATILFDDGGPKAISLPHVAEGVLVVH